MKCYLMAGLIQDFEISRKSGQCLLLSEGFQQSYDQQTSPQEQQAAVLVQGVSAARELEGAQGVLIVESFSQDALGHGLGVHKSCTSQGCATYGLRFIGLRVREAAAVRAALLVTCSSLCVGGGGRQTGAVDRANRVVSK